MCRTNRWIAVSMHCKLQFQLAQALKLKSGSACNLLHLGIRGLPSFHQGRWHSGTVAHHSHVTLNVNRGRAIDGGSAIFVVHSPFVRF